MPKIIIFAILSFIANYLWRRQRYLRNANKISSFKADLIILIAGIMAIISIYYLVINLGWWKGLIIAFLMFGLSAIFQE